MLDLHSEATQKKLVMIKDLKLDLAIQMAKMDETATRDTGELHCHPSGAGARAPVHKLHTSQKKDKGMRNQGKDTYRCYRCNGRGHISDDCRFKDETCHWCGEHVAHVAWPQMTLLVGKHVQPRFVHTSGCTGPVIHENNKPI